MKEMGKRIKTKRVECGMTLEELGEKLGVQRQAVSKWEHGEVEYIKRSHIAKMAEIFGCNPAWLMGFDNAPVTLTYSAPGREPVMADVDDVPIIGAEATSRAALYQAAMLVKEANIPVAIQLLKSLQ